MGASLRTHTECGATERTRVRAETRLSFLPFLGGGFDASPGDFGFCFCAASLGFLLSETYCSSCVPQASSSLGLGLPRLLALTFTGLSSGLTGIPGELDMLLETAL